MYNKHVYSFLVSIALLFCCVQELSSKEIVYTSRDSSIVINPYPIPDNHGPKSPGFVPISASYESLLTSVILTFSNNLGEIEIEVFNVFSGYYNSCIIDTLFLSAVIPIYGGPGHYIITFTLLSGQQYQGEFSI